MNQSKDSDRQTQRWFRIVTGIATWLFAAVFFVISPANGQQDSERVVIKLHEPGSQKNLQRHLVPALVEARENLAVLKHKGFGDAHPLVKAAKNQVATYSEKYRVKQTWQAAVSRLVHLYRIRLRLLKNKPGHTVELKENSVRIATVAKLMFARK